MNKTIRYIAAALLALASTSCLDLSPQDQLSEADLWNKPGDFENFANNFYGWLPDFNTIYDNLHADKRSDLVRDKGGVNTFANGTNSVPQGDSDYTGTYSHIRRCNILIENAAGYANQAEIAQYLGEAYFFRAWNYFVLLQKFGDAIIVDHTIDVDDALMTAARNDRSEVADFIIKDLQTATGLLKPTKELAEGRVGVEGAWGFLARVALFEGTWQKFRGNEGRGKELCGIAANAAEQVMNSGNFELFAPATLGEQAYRYMFILEDVTCNPAGLTKSANHEYIIKRCYDPTLKVIGKNINVEVLANAQIINGRFADMYLCQDGLPIEKSSQFKGYQTVLSEWQNRDNRMKTTLMRPGDTFWSISEKGCRINWKGDEEEMNHAEIKNFLPNWGNGYFPQKWATEHHLGNANDGSYDWPVLRYAEVLLTYAEAKYEQNDRITDEELNRSLNLVRRRVNPNMPALTNALVNANGLDMRQEIRRERTVEFFQEGFRIDDLRRWKTAETEMPKDFVGIHHVGEWRTRWANPGMPTDSEGRLIYETNRQWGQRNYLHPLPVDQLQLNPNLKQNPGWE